jgi:hypothetical protein
VPVGYNGRRRSATLRHRAEEVHEKRVVNRRRETASCARLRVAAGGDVLAVTTSAAIPLRVAVDAVPGDLGASEALDHVTSGRMRRVVHAGMPAAGRAQSEGCTAGWQETGLRRSRGASRFSAACSRFKKAARAEADMRS